MQNAFPAIDIRRDQTVGYSKSEFEAHSESVAQIHNAEKLRSQLIGLALTRADNKIGLAQLEGKALDLDVENQRNQTRKAKFAEELQRTNLALLKVDGLTIQGAIEGIKNSALTLDLSVEQQRLEQAKKRHQLELQAADIELKRLEIDTNAARQLTAQKTKQTIDVPARRVA